MKELFSPVLIERRCAFAPCGILCIPHCCSTVVIIDSSRYPQGKLCMTGNRTRVLGLRPRRGARVITGVMKFTTERR